MQKQKFEYMKFSKYPKAYKFEHINLKNISESILQNALMFLAEGIEQIDKNPRQSIVSFWTGVELFIKAILVEEHWSLIVKDTKKVNHTSFKNGNFVSIDFQHSINLLENIFNITLEHKTKIAFEILRKHRNKIVHFTNQEIEDKHGFELCGIFVELSNVWNELKGLYLPTIDFGENKILRLYDNISDALDKHNVILEGKYRHVYETKLKNVKESDILKCLMCDYDAVILKPVNSILHEGVCYVCEDVSDVLIVPCEHCGHKNNLHRSETFCVNCHKQIDIMAYILGKDIPKNEYQLSTCHRCGSKSVVCIDSIWYCLNCFSLFGKPNICENCGSSVTCSTRTSHRDGCICCDGPDNIGNNT